VAQASRLGSCRLKVLVDIGHRRGSKSPPAPLFQTGSYTLQTQKGVICFDQSNELNPFRLVSLMTILRFYADTFVLLMSSLQLIEGILYDKVHKTKAGPGWNLVTAPQDSNTKATKEDTTFLENTIDVLDKECIKLELDAAHKLIEHIIIKGLPNVSLGHLQEQVRILREIIERELGERLFIFISKDKAPYLNKRDGFGIDVAMAFPSAGDDIKEACNCFALGLDTSCIFHLMRVAEIGLRTLAWDRRIVFKRNAPIELRELKELLDGLEEAEKKIQTYPKTKARETQFEFYHGAMIELRAFKNLYRSRTMHAREFYGPDQTIKAMTHVTNFMVILATKISEKKRTPLVWKRV